MRRPSVLHNADLKYSLPEPLYFPGAPVWICGGDLLRAADGQLCCLLRIQSISERPLRSLTVALQALDAEGAPLCLELPFRYANLHVTRDQCFGETRPIILPLEEAASFRARVLRADFTEGEAWLCEEPWPSVPKQASLEEHYGSAELADQFRIRYGSDCQYAMTLTDDLWLCTCGAINHAGEVSCHRCHRVRSAQENVDTEALSTESASRAIKEVARKEQAKVDNRAAVKKLLLAAAVVIPILTLVLGLLIALPKEVERKHTYASAQWLMSVGEFDEAKQAFLSLGDYRDSAEMAEYRVEYLRALDLMDHAAKDDASALLSIGHTRADLNDELTAGMLLYEAARDRFLALGGYEDSEARAEQCTQGIADCQKTLVQAAYDRAAKLMEDGKLSQARSAYLALGEEEMAKEASYRKAESLVAFIQRYNVRGISASLSMDPDGITLFSLPKEIALALGSQSVADLLASCREDPVDVTLEDTPPEGLQPLDRAVNELLGSLGEYRDSQALLKVVASAVDYSREFFTLCETGDIYGAYDWLINYTGEFAERERWLSDLELYKPFCANWELYLGDSTVIPLTVKRDGKCGSFRSRVLIQDGVATLRISSDDGYSIDLYAEQGSSRFYNDRLENYHYLVVINNVGHMSYLKYNLAGQLASSCEYSLAG